MKFKDLTKRDIEHITSRYSSKDKRDFIQDELSETYGISKRTVRYWAKQLGVVEVSDDFTRAQNKEVSLEAKRFIISWAQNSTPVFGSFLKNMEAYAEYIDAEILVIAGRYKNPTSVFPDKDKEKWDDSVLDYLDANRHDIHSRMSILSDIKIQPTAKMPLTSFESVSGDNSCIIGHPRVHQKTVPVLEGYDPKIMLTTGACTLSNYTDSKAGKVADFHHTFGFAIVELDGDYFHVRQVTACSDGSFTDLYHNVHNGEVKHIWGCSSFVFGDIHTGDTDMPMVERTLKLLEVLVPDNIVVHDLFNGHSVNRHEEKNPIKTFFKIKNDRHLLKDELHIANLFLANLEGYTDNVVVVRSNHDEWIDTYIETRDWHKDIMNADTFMMLAGVKLAGEAPKGILPYYINKYLPNIKALSSSESYIANEFELAIHGHLGANGSRGGVLQFKRLNIKMITGHTHVPSRYDGVVTVGTSTHLRVGYNVGASGWLQSHAIEHLDGKVQQIHFINNKYTTL